MAINYEFNAFRFYDDDAGEAASTPLADQDTNINIDISGGNVIFQLRTRIDNDGDIGPSGEDWALRYNKNSAGFVTLTTSDTGDGIKAATAGLDNETDTTNRSTNGITDPGGLTYDGGEQSTDGTVANSRLAASGFHEDVYGVEIVAANVTNGDVFQFDVSPSSGTPITLNVTPTVTIGTAGQVGLPIPLLPYAQKRSTLLRM